jgi:epoxyqueuosine reductase
VEHILATGEWTSELTHWLHLQAIAAGFDIAGVAAVEPSDSPSTQTDAERFSAWIAAGRAGEMDYLKRRDPQGVYLRSEVRIAMPWAKSVIVCALNYNAAAPRSIDAAPSGTGWIARYAWSGKTANETPNKIPNEIPDETPDETPHENKNSEAQDLVPSDYHDQLLHRLRHIESALQQHLPCHTRCYVDTGPLVERTVAAGAGVGWIGKNTCVINQQKGSWLLLGVIVTSLPIAATTELTIAEDRCGTCTRCIDACPTDALVAPRQMDASRCIAYLTIEKKGSIAEDLREHMGRQVFGCDICQDVCPWNRRAPVSRTEDMRLRPQLVNPPLDWLAAMDAAEFKRWFKGSPLDRTRLPRLQRNVAIAMGNSGDPAFLNRLQQWSLGDDPILAETATWAIQRLKSISTP